MGAVEEIRRGLDAGTLVGALVEQGVGLTAGVPCSLLAPLINASIADPALQYVGATSEGEAAGWAMGAWLGGSQGAVLCQNSGVGNLVNPIATLSTPCRIPFLVVTSLRGRPGDRDEPQHEVMGRVTAEMLELIGVRTSSLIGVDELVAGSNVQAALERIARRDGSQALIVERNDIVGEKHAPDPSLDGGGLPTPERRSGPRKLDRAAALQTLLEVVPDDCAIIASTGYAGRDLAALADRPQHFYMVGAMGCASAIGGGVAAVGRRPVVVVDGDGAGLMKLGNFATIGATPGLSRLVHLLIDNQAHDSTGGQPTVSRQTDLAGVAASCGYASVVSCASSEDLADALRRALGTPGPHFIHVRATRRSDAESPRPTVHPADVALRFREWNQFEPGGSDDQ